MGGDGNLQHDLDVVLQRMHDRKRRRRLRDVPSPPPGTMRSLRRHILVRRRENSGGRLKRAVLLSPNGGRDWAADAWGMA